MRIERRYTLDQVRQSRLDWSAAYSEEFGYWTFQYNGAGLNLIAKDLLFKDPVYLPIDRIRRRDCLYFIHDSQHSSRTISLQAQPRMSRWLCCVAA